MKKVSIHKTEYTVNVNEFNFLSNPDLYPMNPRSDVAELDRLISFIKELKTITAKFICISNNYKNYIFKNIKDFFDTDSICADSILYTGEKSPLFCDNYIIISKINENIPSYRKFVIGSFYVYVKDDEKLLESFYNLFRYCILHDTNIITYDNLVNLLIMVKDAGDEFKEVLEKNLSFCDELTVLDTGSTDNTISIVKEILKKKKGKLYERPWKGFRDSRNELLELAGNKYAFNIMLDDTYILRENNEGDLRKFLTIARADDEADSYSLFIKDDFITYSSNRISKPDRKLRYIYNIHEILEPNKNFEIPAIYGYITDEVNPYMKNRTIQRHYNDIFLLKQEIKNDPQNDRHYYYLAETYLSLQKYEKALKYYKKRAEKEGFIGEIHDSYYKIAVISYFMIKYDWDICLNLFLKTFEKTQEASPLYIIGYHYLNIKTPEFPNGNRCTAYMYLQRAFEVSKSYKNTTSNSKYKINLFDIPNLLLPLCYEFKNWQLGMDCSFKCNEYTVQNKHQNNFTIWISLFYLCVESEKYSSGKKVLLNDKETICFLAPGGWDKWDGETLTKKGLGGSETCVIRYAEYMAKIPRIFSKYNVVIVCNCENERVYNNVRYVNLYNFPRFVTQFSISYCFINRYPEYIPVCNLNNIPNIYLVLHDLVRDNDIIPDCPNLKKVICLTHWHANTVSEAFPIVKEKINAMSYGINIDSFPVTKKIPYTFIFPSFPNRGLIPLLQMFPKILEKYPNAVLNVFCDMNNKWLQDNWKEYVDIVKQLIRQPNVVNHGWVSESVLLYYWSISHIWLYPCTFKETFCRCALEAAASKTLVVTSDLAALNETVGKNGIIITGNASTSKWQDMAINILFDTLDNPEKATNLIESNYDWACSKKYENVVNEFTKLYVD